MDNPTLSPLEELQQLRARGLLSEAAYQTAVSALQPQPTQATVQTGAAAQGADAKAVGERGVLVEGDVQGSLVTGQQIVVNLAAGATMVMKSAVEEITAVDRHSTLGHYLTHLIGHTRYLHLQGIDSGGHMVHIELEHIYITLRATQQRTVQAEERWLKQEARLAPGEQHRPGRAQLAPERETITETVTVTVNEALAAHRRLVVLGDPGCGKTTLLRYLALIYARDVAQQQGQVANKLTLPQESGFLPILMPLRQIGAFLHHQPEDGTEGHRLLLSFLYKSLSNERVELPHTFFDAFLTGGRAVVLLDGLDEVAETSLRQRVARLVEAFTRAYPDCRYVVTSRVVGYSGTARLGEEYTTTTVRDFTLADVEQFLSYWHQLVAVKERGEAGMAYAASQTRELMAAIQANERIHELAINPLMLTVIALIHRDRVRLPDRRAELYKEAVDVLLGKWDEAKQMTGGRILPDEPFDTGDKRLVLQQVALAMHLGKKKEIETEPLRDLLTQEFRARRLPESLVQQAVERFLRVIEERSGLLVARGQGVYAFSHLTFQEYLAALAVAGRNDYVAFTVQQMQDSWWREVILLEAGYLSTQSQERTTALVQALAEERTEQEPYHNLVLAAECVRDVGGGRVRADVAQDIQKRLRKGLETPPPAWTRWLRNKTSTITWLERRAAAATALARTGAGFWSLPYGEPEWVEVPAGAFLMGNDQGDEKPPHRLHLEAFWIARTPITNAQYLLFVQATNHQKPKHWEGGKPPKGKESHPVIHVTWFDAVAYCGWLSQVTGQVITLPSEAEWEKAARGTNGRMYPWGDQFDWLRCNTDELGMGDTTPVGIFPEGASPYGVLEMSGNVWEWTNSQYRDYPYQPGDGREGMDGDDRRVLRGGAWFGDQYLARAAYRNNYRPDRRSGGNGFRVVVRRPPSH